MSNKQPEAPGCLATICVAIMIGLLFTTCSDDSSSSSDSDKWDALDLAEKHLKNNYLKAPATAEFKHVPLDEISRVVQKTGKDRYRVKSYVDAQNSFGATVRTNFTIDIYKKNGSWYAENLRTY